MSPRVRRRLVEQVDLLAGLNPEQREVVLHDRGPLRVGAVAGAGKTKALTHRIAYLVRERGVDPERILAVTFSKKAADEMNERLAALIGESGARVGTFHSLAFQVIREARPAYRQWRLDDSDRYRFVVKDVLGFRGMDWKAADLTLVLQFIGRCKASMRLPGSDAALAYAQELYDAKPCAQRTPRMLAQAYEAAEVERENRQMLTFDDMLLEAWRELAGPSTTLATYQAKWDYVLQDEAQDESPVQTAIAELLAAEHRNYMVVGDPAQSIYGFRGATPEPLLRFHEHWHGATSVEMARNYRSGSAILEAANGSLRAMREGTRLDMLMVAERGEQGRVEVMASETLDQEGEAIVERLMQAHEDGVRWGDMAVLYRTNAQSRGVEEACLGNRIPYVVIGGTNFYDRKEVKALLSYLRVATGRGTFVDAKACINAPFRFLGKAYTEHLERAAPRDGRLSASDWCAAAREAANRSRIKNRQIASVEEWCELVTRASREAAEPGTELETFADERSPTGASGELRRKGTPASILEWVVQETKYVDWLTRDEGTESVENNRVSNVRELIRAAERFPTVDDFLGYVDEVLEEAAKAKAAGDTGDRVVLTSLHRSKGLEWPVVALAGVNEAILPHARCEDDNEERRLFYVGVTRARDLLVVSHVRKAAVGAKVVELEPSRFIAEAGLGVPSEAPCEVQGTTPTEAAVEGEGTVSA